MKDNTDAFRRDDPFLLDDELLSRDPRVAPLARDWPRAFQCYGKLLH